MKMKVAILMLVLCVTGTTTAFARGYYGPHGGYNGYYGRSHYYGGYRGYGHHHDGGAIAVGVMGGLLLGSALAYSAAPPPRTVVYSSPNVVYQPEVVVQQPRVCVEERVVSGEWQMSQYDGRQVWVSFPYPMTRRIQVPCY